MTAQSGALRLVSSRQGAEPARPVITGTASKASRLSQSALEPWPARSLPGAGKQGLGNSHLLRLTLFHKNHWILHASVTPTSTPCPHDPVPATGKGFCVFFLFSSRLSVCVCVSRAMNLRHRHSSGSSGGVQLSDRCIAFLPQALEPRLVAYIVCVRTRTSSELKILRHAWKS